MHGYPHAYIDYLVYFHAERDYFECHEVMEEYWKEHPGDPLALAYVGLIQVAVGLYHHRRGNRRGALKMLTSAAGLLTPERLTQLGIEAEPLRRSLESRIRLLEQPFTGGPTEDFEDINFQIQDKRLMQACLSECERRQVNWESASDMNDTYLINKHTRRDRSEVITERQRQKLLKSEQRGE